MIEEDHRVTRAMRATAIDVHPVINGDKTTHYVWRNGRPLQPHDTSDAAYAEADRIAEEILEVRGRSRDQGRTSRDRAIEAERATRRLVELVAEVNARHPKIVPAEVHDGDVRWLNHRFADHVALEAQILVLEWVEERQRAYQKAVDQGLIDFDATIRLSLSETVDQGRNRRKAWGDQEVDLMVPPTHPAFPTTGVVELVDGRAVIDTLTRDDLALFLGVPFPETIDERAERNRALQEVRETARQRAEAAAAKAREAAVEAEQVALAMHHAATH